MEIAAIEPGDEDLEQGIDVARTYLQANPGSALAREARRGEPALGHRSWVVSDG